MRTKVESFNASISVEIRDQIVQDVTMALSRIETIPGEFVVNDTLWFWKNPAGKVRPTVVNSAGYISKTFQNELEELGWLKEPVVAGQNFDAMLTVTRDAACYSIEEDRYLTILADLRSNGYASYGEEASAIYRNYVKSSSPFLPSDLVPFIRLFETETREYHFRIGLEFETGNIASSFRAIEKLQGLFDTGEIDIGVFVTSKNKSEGAARIWPISNRNGSFEELRQRRYDARRTYPHIDVSFLPDRFSDSAKYISENGIYEMRFTGETVAIEGITYKVAVNPRNEVKLLPMTSATLSSTRKT